MVRGTCCVTSVTALTQHAPRNTQHATRTHGHNHPQPFHHLATLAGDPAHRAGSGAGDRADRRQRVCAALCGAAAGKRHLAGLFRCGDGGDQLQVLHPVRRSGLRTLSLDCAQEYARHGHWRSDRRDDPGLHFCLCAGALQHAAGAPGACGDPAADHLAPLCHCHCRDSALWAQRADYAPVSWAFGPDLASTTSMGWMG